MPNGDMSPMSQHEIDDFLVALLSDEEMQTLINGGGFPPIPALVRRASQRGATPELLHQVFGEANWPSQGDVSSPFGQ